MVTTTLRRTLSAAFDLTVFVLFACLVAYVVAVFVGLIPALPGELK